MHGHGLLILSVLFALSSCVSPHPGGQATPEYGRQAEEPLHRLADEELRQNVQQPLVGSNEQAEPSQNLTPTLGAAPDAVPDQDRETEYLLAVGRGDMKKGPLICERVADTAARAELAKLIRVHIKEHATDRVREQSGQPLEQNIEVIREEITNELLQDVKIIDRSVDKATGTCSSTAVMPKKRITAPGEPSPGAAVK